MMKLFVLCCFLSLTSAYKLEYDLDTHDREETGVPGQKVTGMYSFDTPIGDTYKFHYVADRNGYRIVEKEIDRENDAVITQPDDIIVRTQSDDVIVHTQPDDVFVRTGANDVIVDTGNVYKVVDDTYKVEPVKYDTGMNLINLINPVPSLKGLPTHFDKEVINVKSVKLGPLQPPKGYKLVTLQIPQTFLMPDDGVKAKTDAITIEAAVDEKPLADEGLYEEKEEDEDEKEEEDEDEEDEDER